MTWRPNDPKLLRIPENQQQKQLKMDAWKTKDFHFRAKGLLSLSVSGRDKETGEKLLELTRKQSLLSLGFHWYQCHRYLDPFLDVPGS